MCVCDAINARHSNIYTRIKFAAHSNFCIRKNNDKNLYNWPVRSTCVCLCGN